VKEEVISKLVVVPGLHWGTERRGVGGGGGGLGYRSKGKFRGALTTHPPH